MAEIGSIEIDDYAFTCVPGYISSIRRIMPYRPSPSVICPCIEDILWLNECYWRRFAAQISKVRGKSLDDLKAEEYERTRKYWPAIFRKSDLRDYTSFLPELSKKQDGRYVFGYDGEDWIQPPNISGPARWMFVGLDKIKSAPATIEYVAVQTVGRSSNYDESNLETFPTDSDRDLFNRKIQGVFGKKHMYLDEIEIAKMREHILAGKDKTAYVMTHRHVDSLQSVHLEWSFYAASILNAVTVRLKADPTNVEVRHIFDYTDSAHPEESQHSDYTTFERGYVYRDNTSESVERSSLVTWSSSLTERTAGFVDANVTARTSAISLKDIRESFDVRLYVRFSSISGSRSTTSDYDTSRSSTQYDEHRVIRIMLVRSFEIDERENAIRVGSGDIYSMATASARTVETSYSISGSISGGGSGRVSTVSLDEFVLVLVPKDEICCDRVDESELLTGITDNYERNNDA